ncbi:hypothetical protein [Listeria booriae]|nr:hypothetical protein [Listeria booriae]MBC2675681.1 hypothetical protein [Listeria booriae]
MKKTLSILLITTLILPVSLSNVQAEETDSPSSQNNESAFLEENIIESPFESPEMTPPQNVNLRVA